MTDMRNEMMTDGNNEMKCCDVMLEKLDLYDLATFYYASEAKEKDAFMTGLLNFLEKCYVEGCVTKKKLYTESDYNKYLEMYYWYYGGTGKENFNYVIYGNTLGRKNIADMVWYLKETVNEDVDWLTVLDEASKHRGKSRRKWLLSEDFAEAFNSKVSEAYECNGFL